MDIQINGENVILNVGIDSYIDTHANFELDSGMDVPVVPASYISILYQPDIKYNYVTSTGADPQNMPWTEGDTILASFNAIQSAKELRLNPILSPEEELAQAVALKYSEADAYAQNLINEAYAHPTSDAFVDGFLYEKIVNARRKDKADKLAGEIALDQTEKDEAKTDQKLSEYEWKVQTANEKARTNIDKGNDADEVMAMDIPTITTWPEWISPV